MPRCSYSCFGEKILENVQTYKYLGVVLHKNGKFSAAILDRISQTKRALHVVKQILGYSSNAPVKLAMSVADPGFEDTGGPTFLGIRFAPPLERFS